MSRGHLARLPTDKRSAEGCLWLWPWAVSGVVRVAAVYALGGMTGSFLGPYRSGPCLEVDK